METIFLVVVETPRGRIVAPRRLALERRDGDGLEYDSPAQLAPEWRRSTSAAWRAACALAGRRAGARVSVAGTGVLAGESAGLPLGLAALATLLERPLPPHFATGSVTDDGFLAGGLATAEKARAAADLARQRKRDAPLFLHPPLLDPPDVPGVRLRAATDLGTAYRALDPEGYARIADAHRALRDAPGAPDDARIEPLGPHLALVTVTRGGRLLWRAPAGPGAPDDWARRARDAA